MGILLNHCSKELDSLLIFIKIKDLERQYSEVKRLQALEWHKLGIESWPLYVPEKNQILKC